MPNWDFDPEWGYCVETVRKRGAAPRQCRNPNLKGSPLCGTHARAAARRREAEQQKKRKTAADRRMGSSFVPRGR